MLGFKPDKSEDILGNKKNIAEIKNSIENYSKPIILSGPQGSGKSLCVNVIANEIGYEIVKIDENLLKDDLEKIISSCKQRSLVNKKKIFIVDNLNAMKAPQIRKIYELFESCYPVVLIADDLYAKKLRNISSYCKKIKFTKVRYDSIAKYLSAISAKNNLDLDDKDVLNIARNCNGDIRAAINDLFCESSSNERQIDQNVFETMKIIFKTKNIDNVHLAVRNSEKNLHQIILWLYENILQEYSKDDYVKAMEFFSLLDIYESRILKRQSWNLQSYYPDIISGISLSKQEPYRGFVKYQPPKFKKKKEPENIEKISKNLHMSKSKALKELPLIEKIMSS